MKIHPPIQLNRSRANAVCLQGTALQKKPTIQRAIGAGKRKGDTVANVHNYNLFRIERIATDEPIYGLVPASAPERDERIDSDRDTHMSDVDTFIAPEYVYSDNPNYEFYQGKGARRIDPYAVRKLMDKFTTPAKRFDYFAQFSDYKLRSGVNRFQDPNGTVTYSNSSSAPFAKAHYMSFWRRHVEAITTDEIRDRLYVIGDNIGHKVGYTMKRENLWNDRKRGGNESKYLRVNSSRSTKYTLLQPGDISSNSENFVMDLEGGGKTPTPELSSAFSSIGKGTSHKDIIHLMKTLATGGDVDGITTSRLNELIEATPFNQTWLASKFRFSGKHEWLPSNMVYEVIKKAETKGKDLKWIQLQDTLTSDTGDVIFKPSKAKVDAEVDATRKSLQGHSGAIYGKRVSKSNKPLTQGQADFHDALRKKFRAATTPKDCVDRLKTVAEAWVWRGESTSGLSNNHSRGGGSTGKTSLSTLKSEQPAAYRRVSEKFEQVKERL